MRSAASSVIDRALVPRLRVVALAVLCLLASTALTTAAQVAETATGPAPGSRPAFDFSYEDVNPRSASFGERVALHEAYAGGGVVLNFIASWCAPCWLEAPAIQKLYLEGPTPVIGVAADEYEGGSAELLRRLERFELTFPVLLVPVNEIELMEQHYDHSILPTTYLIDSRGGIRKVLQGMLTEEQLFRETAQQFGGGSQDPDPGKPRTGS